MIPASMLIGSAASLFSSGISNLGQELLKSGAPSDSQNSSASPFASLLQGGKNLPSSTVNSDAPVVETISNTPRTKANSADADTGITPDQMITDSKAAMIQLQAQYNTAGVAGMAPLAPTINTPVVETWQRPDAPILETATPEPPPPAITPSDKRFVPSVVSSEPTSKVQEQPACDGSFSLPPGALATSTMKTRLTDMLLSLQQQPGSNASNALAAASAYQAAA